MEKVERRLSVITSAPNQNREYFDEHLERLIPYFAARALNRIVSINQGIEPLNIDAWNSFGHPMDQAYKKQTRFDGATREEYSSLLIDEKYALLEKINIDTSHNEIVRDDDTDTIKWMQEKLGQLYEENVIYEDTESVSACVDCKNVIAVATSNAQTCSRCGSTHIRVEKRKTLFLDLPGDRLDYVRGKIVLPKKAGFINGQFATLPGRIMVARNRDYGQPLGVSGYEDMVLDPKVGLALMPEMIANKYGLETVTQVQGATTAKNTTPYTSILSPDLTARYIFTGNIPSRIDEERLKQLGTDFFTKYLPIYMLDRVGNIDHPQLQSLGVEYSKAKRKIDNAMLYLDSSSGSVVSELPRDLSRITGAIGNIATYNVRKGVMDMRKYIYEDLGGRYIDDLRARKVGVSSNDLRKIKNILGEVF